MLSENELVERCSRNDRSAQKVLYDHYCKKMMVICMRYARSVQEAEDALQEGFIKVFSKIHLFRSESKLETWITRIMINTSINNQRQKLYMLPMIDVEKANLEEEGDLTLASFHLEELIRMVQSLPDGCRVVFNLFAVEGYNHKEIGQKLGISEGTSKSQYHRARSLLREMVQTQYGEYGKAKI